MLRAHFSTARRGGGRGGERRCVAEHKRVEGSTVSAWNHADLCRVIVSRPHLN